MVWEQRKLADEGYVQYDFFTDPAELEKERRMQQAVIGFKKRYGNNAIYKSSFRDIEVYMGKYDDIIGENWTGVRQHNRMSLENRAKIFMPFAALKGYEEAIEEKQVEWEKKDISVSDIDMDI